MCWGIQIMQLPSGNMSQIIQIIQITQIMDIYIYKDVDHELYWESMI